jgi:hypothetical protein
MAKEISLGVWGYPPTSSKKHTTIWVFDTDTKHRVLFVSVFDGIVVKEDSGSADVYNRMLIGNHRIKDFSMISELTLKEMGVSNMFWLKKHFTSE